MKAMEKVIYDIENTSILSIKEGVEYCIYSLLNEFSLEYVM